MIAYAIPLTEDMDNQAFMADIYFKYERLMRFEIYGVSMGRLDVEDVLQTALVKLIEKTAVLRALEERQRVSYLITTVKNTAISALRVQARAIVSSLDDEVWAAAKESGADNNVEELVFRRNAVAQLESIWPMLDEKSRFLLESRYFGCLSDAEIASRLGIKPNSVRMELSRARKKAKQFLELNDGERL